MGCFCSKFCYNLCACENVETRDECSICCILNNQGFFLRHPEFGSGASVAAPMNTLEHGPAQGNSVIEIKSTKPWKRLYRVETIIQKDSRQLVIKKNLGRTNSKSLCFVDTEMKFRRNQLLSVGRNIQHLIFFPENDLWNSPVSNPQGDVQLVRIVETDLDEAKWNLGEDDRNINIVQE